jgi:hypothetical protein
MLAHEAQHRVVCRAQPSHVPYKRSFAHAPSCRHPLLKVDLPTEVSGQTAIRVDVAVDRRRHRPVILRGHPVQATRAWSGCVAAIAPIVHAAFETLAENRPPVCPGPAPKSKGPALVGHPFNELATI